jgi:type III restriction enzyme
MRLLHLDRPDVDLDQGILTIRRTKFGKSRHVPVHLSTVGRHLLAHVIRLVERFLASDRIAITPAPFNLDDLRRRIMLTVNMNKVVQHVFERIRFENVQTQNVVFDRENPTRRTGDMRPWHTGRPCEFTQKSHINFCVYDSTWEATEAYELDRAKEVDAWVKNDHLGFEILYRG